jgi:hypothetical protein
MGTCAFDGDFVFTVNGNTRRFLLSVGHSGRIVARFCLFDNSGNKKEGSIPLCAI